MPELRLHISFFICSKNVINFCCIFFGACLVTIYFISLKWQTIFLFCVALQFDLFFFLLLRMRNSSIVATTRSHDKIFSCWSFVFHTHLLLLVHCCCRWWCCYCYFHCCYHCYCRCYCFVSIIRQQCC